jgi:hypothetical protein
MKTMLKFSLPLLSLALLASCSESSSSGSDNSPTQGGSNRPNVIQNEVIVHDGSNIKGHYAGDIWPMNYNLHFKKIGAFGLSRQGDDFSVSIAMKYGPKNTKVRQSLYRAQRCPSLKDDLNKDAYIDVLEARLALGQIVIPFDGDLDSQDAGAFDYPTVGPDGKYFYTQTASFDRMFADLKAPDEDPSDEFIKLKEKEGIMIPGSVVLFQGAPEGMTLPETVATYNGESRHESLPVGCAVLWKVDQIPEELNL